MHTCGGSLNQVTAGGAPNDPHMALVKSMMQEIEMLKGILINQ